MARRVAFVSLCLLGLSASLHAAVDYSEDGQQPWSQRADSGPDAEVPGWFYNLGITGMRAQLMATSDLRKNLPAASAQAVAEQTARDLTKNNPRPKPLRVVVRTESGKVVCEVALKPDC